MDIRIGGDLTLNGPAVAVGYLALGMFTYWATDGSDLAWGSTWLWLCLLGWPLVMGAYVLKWFLIAMAVIVGVFAIICGKMWMDNRLAMRRLRRSLDIR